MSADWAQFVSRRSWKLHLQPRQVGLCRPGAAPPAAGWLHVVAGAVLTAPLPAALYLYPGAGQAQGNRTLSARQSAYLPAGYPTLREGEYCPIAGATFIGTQMCPITSYM